MITLPQSRDAWGTPKFETTLKKELELLPVDHLPLQQCLKVGSYVLDEKRSVMILSTVDAGDLVRIKIGIFYSSVIAGCSCADDPTPVEAVNEHCELWLDLDKRTGIAEVTPADD